MPATWFGLLGSSCGRGARRRRGGGSGTTRRWVVEGDDEEVVALERLEHGGAVAAAGDGVAERAGEPVEHGGVEEEGAHVVGLAAQHLLDEVVEDEPVAAGEVLDEGGRVVDAAQRQAGELEPGDPALGAGLEGGDLVVGSGAAP